MTLFVAPTPTSVSGGHVYNRAVLEAWPAPAPTLVELPGAWPDGPGTADTLARALAGQERAVVDGLVGAAHPDVLAAAERDGARVTLLVHLPLADDVADDPGRRSELARRERDSVLACTRVVATSHTAAADLVRRYGRRDVEVALPGAEPGPLARGSDPPLILCLAALTPRKNHGVLLHALGRLRARPWSAVCAGPPADPATVDHLHAVARAARIENRVRFPGAVVGAALEDLWSRTDLLVLPSRAETYGLVVTEAVAHGVPVVVAAGTGAVEALADGPGPDPGVAVDATDPAAVAAAVGLLLDDPVWRARAHARRGTLRPWRHTAELLREPAGAPARKDPPS